MSTLAQDHDCLLLDLDGTVFRGHEPTPGAVETLAVVRSRILFVTNNASDFCAICRAGCNKAHDENPNIDVDFEILGFHGAT